MINYFDQPSVNNYDPAYSNYDPAYSRNDDVNNFLGIGKKARAKREARRAFVLEKTKLKTYAANTLADKGIVAPQQETGFSKVVGVVGNLVSSLTGGIPPAPSDANILNPATGIVMNETEVKNLKEEQAANGGSLTPEQVKAMIEKMRGGDDLKKYLPYILIGGVVLFMYLKK